MAADRHTPGLGRMLELAMATLCHHQDLAVLHEEAYHVSNLHPRTLPDESEAAPDCRSLRLVFRRTPILWFQVSE